MRIYACTVCICCVLQYIVGYGTTQCVTKSVFRFLSIFAMSSALRSIAHCTRYNYAVYMQCAMCLCI